MAEKIENNNENFASSFEAFVRVITPLPIEPVEKNDSKYTKWGDDNLYPNFLIDLMNSSGIHDGILSSKSNYVFGNGVIDKESGEAIGDVSVNDNDTLEELIDKCIKDIVLFNGFAVLVNFSVTGKPISYEHVEFQNVRTNKGKTLFFVNEDWKNESKFLSYPRYNPRNNQDTAPQLFYFTNYRQSVNNVYPSPSYGGAILSIHTDKLVNDLFNNSIGNGFSLAKLLTVYGAVPDEPTKKKATQKFKEVFNGTEGENFLLNFAPNKDSKMEIDSIQADDYASKVVEIVKKVEKNILASHNVSSGSLFNVNNESSSLNNGGGEMELAWNLFKENYVNRVRKQVVSAFNKLFKNNENLTEIDIEDSDFIFRLSDTTREKVYTVNELRKKDNMPEIEGGDVFYDIYISDKLKEKATKLLNDQYSKKKDDEIEKHHATPEDFEKVKDLGTDKSEFISLSKAEFSSESGKYLFSTNYNSIEEYLLDNKMVGMTLDEIAMKISNELTYPVSKSDVQQALDILRNAGLIDMKTNTQTGIIHTAPSAMVNGTKIEVYYDYVKRPEASGATKIKTTRHFCSSIIDSNKYFSANDLQSFSSALGYDVKKYGGGWWKNKDTGVTTKHCRHEFVPVKVIKK